MTTWIDQIDPTLGSTLGGVGMFGAGDGLRMERKRYSGQDTESEKAEETASETGQVWLVSTGWAPGDDLTYQRDALAIRETS